MTYEQILIFMLFIALAARELLPMVLRKFGLINNGKDKVEEMLNLISNHQHTEAREEFNKMNESLKRIEENLIRNFARETS